MKMTTSYTFERNEIEELSYRLIAECVGSDGWNTGTNKRRLAEKFSEDEIAQIKKIYKKCYKWYLVTGVPETVTIENEEYLLWLKLVDYCAKYFTL